MRKLLLTACLLLSMACAAADERLVTMWLAEGETNRLYILGSVHLLRPGDHPLPAAIETAYNDAESLIMELDMDDLDAASLQASTRRMGVIQGGRTLRDLMGNELYEQALDAAMALDIPFDMLSKTEPWYAAITVEQLTLMRIGFNPMLGVEMHMASKAMKDGKPIQGLETIDEQLGFLDGLSIDAQNDLLLQTLADGKNIETFMNDMIEAWRNGDVDYLEQAMLEDMAQYPELYDAIVVNRNERWAKSIENLLDDDDDYLIVVGALHLIGEDGLPALLADRGIRIGQLHESF